MILVTGGAGFIGSNFILDWVNHQDEPIINVDKLTYAGNLQNLMTVQHHKNYGFIRGDIADTTLIKRVLKKHRPRLVVHFAAESHVDRSIHDPQAFIQSNIVGTFHLLEATRNYWLQLPSELAAAFRFLHISTDEVYGTLKAGDPAFTERHQYQPNSPYAASKAASDHLVRSYYHTYGLPVLTGNCSNNYGPYQFPEKLIPLCLHHALAHQPLPIYGNGQQVRDWLYVEDHCRAINFILQKGKPGQTYNIGGKNEKTNLSVIYTLCDVLDKLCPRADNISYREQITFVKDRPGHDFRYAIDPAKIESELDWCPKETFASGIRKTVEWYLHHQNWVKKCYRWELPRLDYETICIT
jgi:dTDP-glucose 4,6-dehydratase